ncbi:hypothetical protein [Thiothrix lacustris]|uniref:hypothetical protein n=1 Tax=Thiothrix lacustris TaxID=525917 RepID=UPI00048C8FF7|nr:hypothetical protein [Thiothrix lacustris]
MKKPAFTQFLHGNATPLLCLVLCITLSPIAGWAATAANTLIKNQASATFKDDAGTVYSVTSNMVETLVQQAAGLELEQTQSKLASPGGTVEFTHVVTNTGNGDDSYTLAFTQSTGDNFDFSTVSFYADKNQDGQADTPSTPITKTPLLKAGESFAFVAIAGVPASAVSGNNGALNVVASSTFATATQKTNTDTANITNKAILDVTKAISANSGKAGSGTYTVTLHYRNTSQVDASNVTLIDALPSGMVYVPNSGRWSESGVTVLTDSNTADTQGSSATVRYCAYDNSCTGIPEANNDADSSTTNQVTGIISQVAAGASGELRFNVSIAAGLPVSVLVNTGEYEFNDSSATTARFNTNKVRFEVVQEAGVVTNGSSTSHVDLTNEPITVTGTVQNGTALFHDFVWNTGNGADSFDITLTGSNFPTGTVFMLYQADGQTPLLDTNDNGIPDTGTKAAGSVTQVVIKASLPASATSGSYEVALKATSFLDDSKTNSALNQLSGISVGSVDLTNNAALGQTGVLGAGAGPESAAVTTRNTLPGSSTRFILFINNLSSAADNYDLKASTDSTFANVSVPTGWSVRFVDTAGNAITNSGAIAAGASKEFFAEVSVPANASTGVTDLYFQVASPVTGVKDIKHDALTVGEVVDVVLFPDNSGQVLPGGSIVYSHWLVNQGNVAKTSLSLATQGDSAGWQSLFYVDTDGSGTLTGADQRLNTIPSLAAGGSKLIFVKVLAAANLQMGASNVTTLMATWDGGASSTFALDVTSTNNSTVNIRKEQALDTNCDGTPETAFSTSAYPAEPRQCVLYQLTATNTGAVAVLNVRIQDATPAYTSFITAGGLPTLTQGALVAPITSGARGRIIGAMGTLEAGYSATLMFGIKIE